MDSHHICYNLYIHSTPEMPAIPEAFIVLGNNKGDSYIEKLATPEIIESYAIPYIDTPHEKLIQICDELKPVVLERRFKPLKKRKNVPLAELLKDPKTKVVLLDFVNRKLAVFYALIIKHKYPICHQADRKDPIENSILTIGTNELQPILEFTKKPDGIEYSFSLKNEEAIIIPKDQTIQILLNEPSWIIVDRCVYGIKGLNANKLKPFFKTDKITIAKKHIKMYLEKVIIPVIKNIDVVANGFDIKTLDTITSYSLEIVQDFIQDSFAIKVIFEYNDIVFDYNSLKTIISNAQIKGEDQIQIIQTKRNSKAEQEIIELLLSKGLQVNNTLLLETKVSDDPYEIFKWLHSNKTALKEDGFNIKPPVLKDKEVNSEVSKVTIDSKKKMTGLISKAP